MGAGVGPFAPGVSPEHLLRAKVGWPVLTDPPMDPANTLTVPADEIVLGAEKGQEAHVYPDSLLRVWHIVNGSLDGEPYMVAYCPRCASGVAFDPVVDGTRLTFEVIGAYQGTFVMRDLETGTLWGHLTGEALAGPLVGHALPQRPVWMSTWEQWLAAHPKSLVPRPPGPLDRGPAVRTEVGAWWRRTVGRPHVLGI